MADPTPDDAARIVDKLYMAAFDDRLWLPVIDDLKEMLGAASASLAFYDLASGTVQSLHNEVEESYAELFVQLGGANPILGWMARQQVGTTVTEGIFLDRPRFESGIFFNEWARPQRYRSSLFTRITDVGGAHGQIAFIRDDSQPLFGAGEIAFIDRIAPDLVRVGQLRHRAGALELAQRFERLENAAIGALATDGTGRILLASPLAERLLAEGSGLRLRSGSLVATARAEHDRLEHLLRDATPRRMGAAGTGGDMLIRDRQTGRPAYAVSVRPIPDGHRVGLPVVRGALVLVRAVDAPLPPVSVEALTAMFGLTRREAELAAALLAGRTLQEASAARGVSLATTRSQLAQVFRKTGTTRQGELVALLLGVLPRA